MGVEYGLCEETCIRTLSEFAPEAMALGVSNKHSKNVSDRMEGLEAKWAMWLAVEFEDEDRRKCEEYLVL